MGQGARALTPKSGLQKPRSAENTRRLAYLVPIVCGSSCALDGKLDLSLYLRGQGDTAALLRQTLAGQATMRVDPSRWTARGCSPSLTDFVDFPKPRRSGRWKGDFRSCTERSRPRTLRPNLGQTPLILSGWTDVDGRVDYRLQTELLSDRVAKETGGLLAELPDVVDDLFETRLTGTLDKLDLTVDGILSNKDARDPNGRPIDDKRA